MSSLCNIHEVTILAVSCSWMNSASDIGTVPSLQPPSFCKIVNIVLPMFYYPHYNYVFTVDSKNPNFINFFTFGSHNLNNFCRVINY